MIEEEEEEPYLFEFCTIPYLLRQGRASYNLHLCPCTLPTAPVSRSFGLRSSYEIDILDTVPIHERDLTEIAGPH